MKVLPHEKFESVDHYRGNQAFSEYVSYHDNIDPVLKEKNLIKFVCKNFSSGNQRRNLIAAIKR